jgi:hypothetical protein
MLLLLLQVLRAMRVATGSTAVAGGSPKRPSWRREE